MKKLNNTKRKKSPANVRVATWERIHALSDADKEHLIVRIVDALYMSEFTTGEETQWDSETVQAVVDQLASKGLLKDIP